jgi:hypothetical protein
MKIEHPLVRLACECHWTEYRLGRAIGEASILLIYLGDLPCIHFSRLCVGSSAAMQLILPEWRDSGDGQMAVTTP